MFLGKFITTKPPVGHLTWWFSKEILPKMVLYNSGFRIYNRLARCLVSQDWPSDVPLEEWNI